MGVFNVVIWVTSWVLALYLVSAAPDKVHASICGAPINDWSELSRILFSDFSDFERVLTGSARGEKKMKKRRREDFTLISYMTEEIYEYGSYASASMLWYASTRGYQMLFFNPQQVHSLHASASAPASASASASASAPTWQKNTSAHSR